MPSLRRLIRPLAIRGLLLCERLESGAWWDPTSGAYSVDPFPQYRRLLERDPVHRSRLMGAWVVSKYADVDAVLRDHERFANDERRAGDALARPRGEQPPGVDRDLIGRSLLGLDPPDHTRLRGLVTKAFTPRAVTTMTPRIEAIVDELLDAVAGPERFDVIEALAYPLPVIVIAEMLGIPPADRDDFKRWSDAFARMLEPTATREEMDRALEANGEFNAYVSQVIEERRREPRGDIISALIAAEDEGERLSQLEMLTMIRLLLAAGNETTTNLIGNGLLALLRHPEQYTKLVERPELIPSAIEELLRYDSPVQVDGRTVVADTELRGKPLRRGEQLVLLLGAANRDPEAYPDPDRLDVERFTREGVRSNLAFGRGIHHCLGAPLARIEGQVAFRALVRRYPRLRLADDRADFRDNIVLRGLRTLPVQVVEVAERAAPASAVAG